jgi:hypothetical protein
VEIKKKLKGGVERAVQSSDYKNIYSAVIDTYTNNTVLKNFAEVRKWVKVKQELCLGKELVGQEEYTIDIGDCVQGMELRSGTIKKSKIVLHSPELIVAD